MKLISDIPCKNCITFAICNAQMSDDSPFEDVLINLVYKCSLVEKYTKSNNDYYLSELVVNIAKYFKPKASYTKYTYEVYKKYILFNSSLYKKECIHYEVND